MAEFDNKNMADEATVAESTDLVESFEVEMLKRVESDYTNFKEFMDEFHRQCVLSYEHYFSASKYTDMRKKNLFPVPFFQQMIDDFVGYVSDKLFYRSQPCTVTPVENGDKGDAEAKQQLFRWMDYKDDIEGKLELMIRDAAMYRVCVAQVDYTEMTKKKLVGVQKPMMFTDEFGQTKPMVIDGQPVMESTVEHQNVPVYLGATVKRVDPTNFFIGQDKSSMDDGKPVIIRSFVSIDYFSEKKYFRNVDRLKEYLANPTADTSKQGGTEVPENIYAKRMIHAMRPNQSSLDNNIEYKEWHGQVDKKKLYEYLGQPTEMQQNINGQMSMVPLVEAGEKVWVICGWAHGTIVRMEEKPFEGVDGPNVILGIMQSDEEEVVGTSLADKIGAVQQGMEVLMGILLENFRQAVNAGHIIKKTALINEGDVTVNKPGWVLETNGNVNDVHKRVEQPRVAPDIYTMLTYYEQLGRDAGGIQRPISGMGTRTADTLGEFSELKEESVKKLVAYLRSIERTLVQPLYDMRNQINIQFLDQPYVYGIIGEGAIEWRKMEPAQLRANVDFICESSTREANRLIITQQILQLGKVAPLATQMGIPVRFDKLLAQLAAQGFSWDRDKVEEIFPTLKMEREGGVDLNQIFLENMMIRLQMEKMAMMMGGMGGPSGAGGGTGPEPRSEGEARQSLQARNQVQPGRMIG